MGKQRKFMGVVLTLTMVMSLLPVLTQTASAATTLNLTATVGDTEYTFDALDGVNTFGSEMLMRTTVLILLSPQAQIQRKPI